MTLMIASTPIAFRFCWMISAVLMRSLLPWLVMIVNRKALPSFSRMPSLFLSLQTA